MTVPEAVRLVRKADAAREIVRRQRRRLMSRYGSALAFVDGWANHNLTHAADVARHAAAGAEEQVALGNLPPEAPMNALIAGYFHDDVQLEVHASRPYPAVVVHRHPSETGPTVLELSPHREALSAETALKAMRDYELEVGEQIFSAADRAMVTEMIDATRITHRIGTRLGQNTSADRVAGAVMADADLAQFWSHDGVRQSLGFHAETEWLQGRLAVPRPGHGSLRDMSPERDRTLAFLTDQERLFADHRYFLDESRRRQPLQRLNAGRIRHLRDGYESGVLTWRGMVDRAGTWAAQEVSRRVREPRAVATHRRSEPARSARPGGRATDRAAIHERA